MRQLKISKQITNRDAKSLDSYLLDISKTELINADEEALLAKRIREGDDLALEKLVKANLRFVVSVAKQYQSKGLSLGDLINEGNVGLVRAASKFDETRGFKFISYAVWWIRQAIMQAIAEHSRMVRLPLNKVSELSKINRTFSDLEQHYQREPTSEELSQVMDISAEQIDTNLRVSHFHLSLSKPVGTDDGTLIDLLEDGDSQQPDSNLSIESLKDDILRVLSASLTEREQFVLLNYFGIGLAGKRTLEDIGEELEMTRERVRQIKEVATRKLKHGTSSELLKQYLN